MVETYQSHLFVSDGELSSDSETLSSETYVDSVGSLRDFVADEDESEESDYRPDSEIASIASTQDGRRLQILDALDTVILELIRLRDLLQEDDGRVINKGGTDM